MYVYTVDLFKQHLYIHVLKQIYPYSLYVCITCFLRHHLRKSHDGMSSQNAHNSCVEKHIMRANAEIMQLLSHDGWHATFSVIIAYCSVEIGEIIYSALGGSDAQHA